MSIILTAVIHRSTAHNYLKATMFRRNGNGKSSWIGANWGDEGKGKITDMLGKESDIIVRFQGGANAGPYDRK